MRATLIPLLVLLAIALLVTGKVLHSQSEAEKVKRGMPPGFYLATNQLGQYSAFYNSGVKLNHYRGKSPSKQNAVLRAWDQFEFNKDDVWTRVEPAEK